MKIIPSHSANYLVCSPLEYYPNKEVLYFGDTKITPGTKIRKIGEKKRTSFEACDESYFLYEGCLNIDDIKYCLFSSTWEDVPGEFLYRYAFAMADTNIPKFLYISTKTGVSGYDIDSTKVNLL